MKKLVFLLLLWHLLLGSEKMWAQQSSVEFRQDTARISEYIAQAHKYFLREEGDSSLYCVKQGFQLSKKWNIITYHTSLYNYWGHYFRLRKEFDKAITMYKRAQQWAWKRGVKEDIEGSGYNLGVAYTDRLTHSMTKANQVAAIRQLYENLRFSSQYNTSYHIDGTYSLLALLYERYGNDSLRYYYYEKLVSISQKNKAPADRLINLYFLFSLSLYKKNVEKAQEYYQELIHIEGKKDFPAIHFTILRSMLDDCVKRGYWDLATQLAAQLKQGDEAYGDKKDRVGLYTNLASIHLHQLHYSKAAKAIQKARRFAQQIIPPDKLIPTTELGLLEGEQIIAEYHKQFPRALALNKRIMSLKDSLRAIYGSFDLISIEERLASEQKERDFRQQLQLKRLENQREAERNQRKIWVAMVIISLLSGVVIVISLQAKKINQQKRKLEALNQTKDRLFSIIGHDLRTPIVSTKINLRRLANQKQISVAEFSSAIQKQLPRLHTLLLTVDNLLYWSHNQKDTFQFQYQKAVLNDVLMEVLEMLEESIEVSKITLQNCLTNELTIMADSNHLRIILRNVIQNAIKFTPQGGMISFHAEEVMPQRIAFVVKDTGMGFEQSQKDISKKGTGWGLKLVKELMELNNGALEIATVQGEGAEVRLLFLKD
ncbi:tetratricopeptide repeat-containing sensor histidine kinase [Runella salmonicolor]|uniref:histidine kinase n=1 Tax=Runella salmonicolor TaxID=2950278 RepID=A0ABT1FXP1_9BACT|nr:HAMP domain-containing sensor histidine kinase [Runella salmonicolor]MCP1386543.1 HAMP domain-containing histidine kinase [Runella salmonicolor]